MAAYVSPDKLFAFGQFGQKSCFFILARSSVAMVRSAVCMWSDQLFARGQIIYLRWSDEPFPRVLVSSFPIAW
jgi:hypothetical protein